MQAPTRLQFHGITPLSTNNTHVQVVDKNKASATLSYVLGMSSRDPETEERDKPDRKERKHKHRDREGKSKHRTTEAPPEEHGGSYSRKDRDKVADRHRKVSASRNSLHLYI